MPRGPSEVRTASATAFAAVMLLRRTSLAFSEVWTPEPPFAVGGVPFIICGAIWAATMGGGFRLGRVFRLGKVFRLGRVFWIDEWWGWPTVE